MDRLTLPGTNITTTRLGYGCASLMARLGRRESLRLLEVAFDSGIRHFDVARMYGYGAAESVVGDFLVGRRDDVTVATKAGLLPPRRSLVLDAGKALARRVVAVSPRMREPLRRRAAALAVSGRFGASDVRASLETSLRELRVDHIDLLLMHECTATDLAANDDLLGFLHEQVSLGTLGGFGIATTPADTVQVIDACPEYASIIQVPSDVLSRVADPLVHRGGRAIITHSAIGRTFALVREHLLQDSSRRQRWSEAIGVDYSELVGMLSGLMLAEACRTNPSGVVLCSSVDERHIVANVAAIGGGRFSPEQAARFAELVASDRGEINSGQLNI